MDPVTTLGRLTRSCVALTAAVLCVCASGCASPSSQSRSAEFATAGEDVQTRLRVGDQLQIRLDTTGGQPTSQSPAPLDAVIDERGEISLPFIGRVQAEGSTPAELAERIQANYVPRYYVRCNVSVLVTLRFFYVGGEVRSPGRYPWTGDITLLKAINTAGSFTDYANRGRVEIIRGKEKIAVNMDDLRRNPNKDVPIRPGDSIWVPRSIF
jgi:protein involved in polysaccharide export with SLBB domain